MTWRTTDADDLVAEIRHQTAVHNRNNLTRTKAYLDFYREHPELEWAFLAHMVSRNSGWNMTDLHGEWLPRLCPGRRFSPRLPFWNAAIG
jgi:hypothetical protein